MKLFNGVILSIAVLTTVIIWLTYGKYVDLYYSLVLLASYIGWWVYLLPMQIAESKNHKYKTPILILNAFGGWSGFLWVGALIWCYIEPND
jgi:hypothetical protein